MTWVLIILYCLALLVIFCYAVLQAGLALKYLQAKKKGSPVLPELTEWPKVTVQLPLYNEKYVAERLVRHMVLLDYPPDKIQFQILDDSTDETTEILRRVVDELAASGTNISLILRESRQGYKAGALAHALPSATGDFIAIFDADFLPDSDFLRCTIPWFQQENVGVVQTRWEHLNRDHSLLTKLQAFALDAHFTVEQVGRNYAGHFINFNGTAGVWRKETIMDAGGWSSDTLTEDLDLSYRAQLKGWKFLYKEDIGAPAELPIAMSALKSQQFRWTKGGAETFKKMAGAIRRSQTTGLSNKIHGWAHLFNSSVFIFVLLLALVSVPMVFLVRNHPNQVLVLNLTSVFFVSTLLLTFYYWVSFREIKKNSVKKLVLFVIRFVQFLTVTMGLSWYNTQAVSLAYLGKKTPFVRTPKFNLNKNSDSWKKNAYLLTEIKFSTIMEGLLGITFLLAAVFEVIYGMYGMVVFHALLSIGFLLVFGYTIVEKFRK